MLKFLIWNMRLQHPSIVLTAALGKSSELIDVLDFPPNCCKTPHMVSLLDLHPEKKIAF